MAKSFPNTGATVGLAADRTAMTSMLEGQEFFETDTNKMFVYSGAGWVQTNSWSTTSGVTGVNNLIVPPSCRVFNSANISIPNATSTLLTFNSERFDTDSMHSTVSNTGRITINTEGLYLLSGHVSFASNAINPRETFIRHNGSTFVGYDFRNSVSSGPTIVSLSTLWQAAATDYFELIVYQNSGSALNVLTGTAYSPEFAATWLGSVS